MSARIAKILLIDTAADKIFQALTTEPGITGWWTRTATIGQGTAPTLEVRFRRGEVIARMDVEQEAPRRVRWKCTLGQGLSEWTGTTITFDLVARDRRSTELRFSHDGWGDETEWFEHCSDGWDYFLDSLKRYVENGEGNPDAGGEVSAAA